MSLLTYTIKNNKFIRLGESLERIIAYNRIFFWIYDRIATIMIQRFC